MIRYTKKFVRFAEAWDGDELPGNGVDIARRFQCPGPRSPTKPYTTHTILIKLRKEPGELLANMKRAARYEIRRAENVDQFACEIFAAHERPHDLTSFYHFFDQFALLKGQPRIDRRWLESMAAAERLWLSFAGGEMGEPLVWHAYYRSPKRATLLHSASLFRANELQPDRQRIGRANRLLHWRDLLFFKAAGLPAYDLGGWYAGQEDPERLRINNFKEQFGGEVVRQFTQEQARTWRGALFLGLRGLLAKRD